MKEVIKNIDKLAEIFGRENPPSFHDAEIVSISLNRNEKIFIDVKLLIYKLIKNIEKDGKKFGHWFNVHADFRFNNVWIERLQGFNHQNVINDLLISKKENSEAYLVHFESIFGCDLEFECQEIELIGLESFETEKERFQPSEEKLQIIKKALGHLKKELGK